jgi:hypothetical protein
MGVDQSADFAANAAADPLPAAMTEPRNEVRSQRRLARRMSDPPPLFSESYRDRSRRETGISLVRLSQQASNEAFGHEGSHTRGPPFRFILRRPRLDTASLIGAVPLFVPVKPSVVRPARWCDAPHTDRQPLFHNTLQSLHPNLFVRVGIPFLHGALQPAREGCQGRPPRWAFPLDRFQAEP